MDLKEKRLSQLIETHKAVRGEIEMRIGQRDTFAIQFLVSCGAIFTLGFLNFKFAPFLFFLLPLVTLFFSVQILYSYTIHDRCHKFLVNEIEPAICQLLEYNNDEKSRYMWESYCEYESKRNSIRTPGIRRGFFEKISLAIPIISSILFFCVSYEKSLFNINIIIIIAVAAFVIFQTVNLLIVLSFNKSNSKKCNKCGDKK